MDCGGDEENEFQLCDVIPEGFTYKIRKGRKRMKKIARRLAVFLATLVLVLSMCIPVSAQGNTYTVTIKGGDQDLSNVTFNAYRMFDITTKSGTPAKYGFTVTDNFQSFFEGESDPYTEVKTSLGDEATYETKNAYLAEIKQYITDEDVVEDKIVTATGTSVQMEDMAAGYYILIPSSKDYAMMIANVVSDCDVYVKAEEPTVTKTTDEGKDKAEAMIGGSVNYEMTAKVPNTTGKDMSKYQFIVYDRMTDGLTYNNDAEITITTDNGLSKLTEGTDYVIKQATGFNQASNAIYTDLLINFMVSGDLSETLKNHVGETITITYSATLNENAIVTEPEKNTAYLWYTNNQGENISGKDFTPNDPTPNPGENPDPDPDKPDPEVEVYTYQFTVNKVDEGDQPLTGAEFELYKGTENTPMQFVAISDTADGDINFDYRVAKAGETGTTNTLISDSNGRIAIYGLETGNYILKETKAPDGYNLLKAPVNITIAKDDKFIQTSDSMSMEVENKSGTLLPETGGTGAVLFAVAGGIIILAAGAVLVLNKKRTNI